MTIYENIREAIIDILRVKFPDNPGEVLQSVNEVVDLFHVHVNELYANYLQALNDKVDYEEKVENLIKSNARLERMLNYLVNMFAAELRSAQQDIELEDLHERITRMEKAL